MSIPSSDRYPGFTAELHFGAGKQSPAAAPRKTIIAAYGNATSTMHRVYGPHSSADDVATQHGSGEELHIGAIAFFEEYPDGVLYTVEYAEAGGGAACAKTITAAGAAGVGGTLSLFINGRLVQVTITAAMTAAQAATAIITEVNKHVSLPVTAGAGVNPEDAKLTWKWKGPQGNQFTFRYSVESITTQTYSIATTTAGATDGDPTACLDALIETDYDYLVTGVDHATATTGIGTFVAEVNERAGPTIGLRGCLIFGFIGTVSDSVTLATGRNAHRVQMVYDRGTDMLTVEMAAKEAGMRARYEQDDPTANMVGPVRGAFTVWRGPFTASDKLSRTEAKNLLNSGVTPIRYTPQGIAYHVRPITTRSQDANGGPDYRTFDVIKVTMLDWMADELASDFPVRFPDYKLQPTAGGPLAANVADERLIKSWINGYLLQYQKNGWVKNVEANQDNLVVTISTVTTGRASAKIPVDVIDLFAQLDADLYQVG
jgi:phage tail sheath gpL-like